MAKKNMSLTKVPMPEQAPDVRNKNFEEVALGYTAEMAMEEAARCLNCKNKPCVSGCPVNVPIPGFIEKVAEGDFEAAYEIITSENALPAICGRVCPQENQCEGKCVRGIKGQPVGIGRMERFVADYHMEHAEPVKADIKKNLEEKKAQEAEADKESKVIEAIVNDSEMDIPEKMIEAQSQQMVEEFAQNIAMQGISFDQYMQFTGTTVDQLTEQVKPQAEARVQSSLVLEAIVKAEKIEASDEEFDEEIKRMAERYQMEADKVNELLSDDDKKNIRADICARKAAKLVVEKAK